MSRETYRALCQIIGEYYQDAMQKDEALQAAMQELCRVRDELHDTYRKRRPEDGGRRGSVGRRTL